jgi:hypothetical protein
MSAWRTSICRASSASIAAAWPGRKSSKPKTSFRIRRWESCGSSETLTAICIGFLWRVMGDSARARGCCLAPAADLPRPACGERGWVRGFCNDFDDADLLGLAA